MPKRSNAKLVLGSEYGQLLSVVLFLVSFGMIWVYSASSSLEILSSSSANNGISAGASAVIKTAVAAALGFAAMVVMGRWFSRVPASVVYIGFVVAMILCVLVLVPGLGRESGGAKRWLGGPNFGIQPSELLKFALVFAFALLLAARRRPIAVFADCVPYLAILAAITFVVAGLQSDLGTAIVIVCSGLVMLWMAGIPTRLMALILTLAILAGSFLVLSTDYRRERFMVFLYPNATSARAMDVSHQFREGRIAIGSGGITGKGIGQGVIKNEWLPASNTDFMLGVVGEEGGLLSLMILIVVYGALMFLGLRIADRATNMKSRLLAAGSVTAVAGQAILNIAVVLGLCPLTGVPLPFISYGPTNLIVMLTGVGILLGVSRQTAQVRQANMLRNRRGVERDEQRGLARVYRLPQRQVPAGISERWNHYESQTHLPDRGGRNRWARSAGARRR